MVAQAAAASGGSEQVRGPDIRSWTRERARAGTAVMMRPACGARRETSKQGGCEGMCAKVPTREDGGRRGGAHVTVVLKGRHPARRLASSACGDAGGSGVHTRLHACAGARAACP